MLVATIWSSRGRNKAVLVFEDNEVVNAKRPQYSLSENEESFRKLLDKLESYGFKVKIQTF